MKHQIYYFNQVLFSELSNGLLDNLRDITEIVNSHIPNCEYYFISTISEVSQEQFSGKKAELTHIYLKSSGKLVELSSIS